MSSIKENVTAEKNSYSGIKSLKREEVPEMPKFKEEPKLKAQKLEQKSEQKSK